MRRPELQPEQIVSEINKLIAEVQEPVIALAQRFIELQREHSGGAALNSAVIDQIATTLEAECLEVLARPAPRLTEGIGLVWEGADDASGMLWWRAQQTDVARKHHVFNPDSDSYYDYRNSVWYRGAYAVDGLTIVGPYIDAWGTDDHALSASHRIVDDNELLGVAASDLNVDGLMVRLDRIWADHPRAVLLGDEDRVIASSMALLTPGLRLDPFLAERGWRITTRVPTDLAAWELVVVGE